MTGNTTFAIICPNCGARNTIVRTITQTHGLSIDPVVGSVWFEDMISETYIYSCKKCGDVVNSKDYISRS
jgi:predicted RNA-binding Zn-ribbon protein involved in translation (DUF1610 family)